MLPVERAAGIIVVEDVSSWFSPGQLVGSWYFSEVWRGLELGFGCFEGDLNRFHARKRSWKSLFSSIECR